VVVLRPYRRSLLRFCYVFLLTQFVRKHGRQSLEPLCFFVAATVPPEDANVHLAVDPGAFENTTAGHDRRLHLPAYSWMTPFLDSPIFEPPSLHLPILGSLIIHAPLVDGFKGTSSSRSKSRAYFGLSQAQKTPWEYPGKTAHHHDPRS
jgi:hypothetical protein